jgi:hypothetical protein
MDTIYHILKAAGYNGLAADYRKYGKLSTESWEYMREHCNADMVYAERWKDREPIIFRESAWRQASIAYARTLQIPRILEIYTERTS